MGGRLCPSAEHAQFHRRFVVKISLQFVCALAAGVTASFPLVAAAQGAPAPAPAPAPEATEAAPTPAPAEPARNESLLGGAGESCRARADCRTGLKCIDGACRDENEGTTCGATSDCGGGELRCIDKVCQNPAAPLKSRDGGRGGSGSGASMDEWLAFDPMEGTHGFAGLGFTFGPTFVDVGNFNDLFFNFHFEMRGGVLIDGLELALEFTPKTYWAVTEQGALQHLGLAGTVGGYIPVADGIYLPIRGGGGMLVVDTVLDRVMAQFRAELGLAFAVGHLLFEIPIPSFRFSTEFEDVYYMEWSSGLRTQYVF